MNRDLEKIIEKIESNPSQEARILKTKARLVSSIASLIYETKFFGLDNIYELPKKEPSIIAWRHLSAVDPFLALVPLVIYSGHEIHAFAKIEAYQGKDLTGVLEKTAVVFCESIPLDRENPDETLNATKKIIGKECPVWLAIAPEGTRSVSGRLLPFNPLGISELIKYGAKNILPVSITYNLSKLNKRKNALVNIGQGYNIETDNIDIRTAVKIANELHKKVQSLNVITIEHVSSILFYDLAEKGISHIPSNLFDNVYPLMTKIYDQGYTVFPDITKTDDLSPYFSALYSMLEKRNIIQNNKLNNQKIKVSFEEYMENPELNKSRSVRLKRGDIYATMDEEDKKIGSSYKNYNPIGYLINNAGPEIQNIVNDAL